MPDVRGATLEAAQARLIGQPLASTVVYEPAKPGKRPGVVVGQDPANGTLSAYDKVQLVVSRAVYGVVPQARRAAGGEGAGGARAAEAARRVSRRGRAVGSSRRSRARASRRRRGCASCSP